MEELEAKLLKIRELLKQHVLDALLLRRSDDFAWATCGADSHINLASTLGVASLLITHTERYLVTDNIEAPRLEREAGLGAQGWKFCVSSWHDEDDAAAGLTTGLKIGADFAFPGAVDLSPHLAHLRASLCPEEGHRFRDLGHRCADAMNAAVRAVRPGMTEQEIAAALARETWLRGVEPTVNLIATDERIFYFRHPLPTDRRMQRYAMLVLCGRKWGLVCSITRLVHFGRLPDELRRKAEAVAYIDALFIDATRPGRRLKDILSQAAEGYRLRGFPDEWHLHHQGGVAGYQPREFLVTPATDREVCDGQAYAWNPSITGTKSEDTILVGEQANEMITAIPGWPAMEVDLNGRSLERPAILEIT